MDGYLQEQLYSLGAQEISLGRDYLYCLIKESHTFYLLLKTSSFRFFIWSVFVLGHWSSRGCLWEETGLLLPLPLLHPKLALKGSGYLVSFPQLIKVLCSSLANEKCNNITSTITASFHLWFEILNYIPLSTLPRGVSPWKRFLFSGTLRQGVWGGA